MEAMCGGKAGVTTRQRIERASLKCLEEFPRRGSRPWRECNARARARTAVSKPTGTPSPKKNCCDKMTVTWTVYQLSH